MFEIDNWGVFSSSVQGYSHIKKNKVCEDYSLDFQTNNFIVIAVSDGHGGNAYFRSQKGSMFACESVKEAIINFDNDVLNKDLSKQSKRIAKLPEEILEIWHKKIAENLLANPITEEELNALTDKQKDRYSNNSDYVSEVYGATLIFAVVKKDKSFGFVFQIGDGNCTVFNKSAIAEFPIKDDPNCVGNITSSLCDKKAIKEFRYTELKSDFSAVFLCTDGIENSLDIDNYPDKIKYSFYFPFLNDVVVRGIETATKEITEYLPKLSQKGNGDDISFAVIYKNEIKNNDFYKNFSIKEAKVKKENEEKIRERQKLEDEIIYIKGNIETIKNSIFEVDERIKNFQRDKEREEKLLKENAKKFRELLEEANKRLKKTEDKLIDLTKNN